MARHNSFDAHFEDGSDQWGQIAVKPSRSRLTVCIDIIGHSRVATIPRVECSVDGVNGCLVARTGYTGEDGFEVFVPSAHTGVVWDALLRDGAAYGVQPIGLGARDTLRLEARFCLYGHELTDTTSPWQAGLAWVTKMDKEGAFVGHSALLRRKGNETHRLVGVLIDGKRIPRAEMRILVGDEDVGWVTSVPASTLGQGIALGYVARQYAKVGSQLTIDVRGREAPCTVVKGAFHKMN